jgi:Reverse transcriptase (RNA-dependent DNA polymerase)
MYILDGVVAAQEILHYTYAVKEPGLIIKLNFEKAFDRLNWEYFLESFEHRGFDAKWVIWIKQILHGGRVCININGSLTEYFESTRG